MLHTARPALLKIPEQKRSPEARLSERPFPIHGEFRSSALRTFYAKRKDARSGVKSLCKFLRVVDADDVC